MSDGPQYPQYPGGGEPPEGPSGGTPPDGPPAYGSTPPPGPPAYGTPAYGTPQGQPYGGQPHPVDPYASWGLRLASYVLDSLIAFAIYLPFYIVGFILISVDTDPVTGQSEGGAPTIIGVILLGISVVLVLAFSIWNYGIRQGRTGQTLGKKIVSIKVLTTDGQVMGAWLSLGRTLLFSILTTCTCYINALWPLWDDKKQALHDKVVKTVVLKA